MEFSEREFIPLILGGDINTYSVARAFYEQYQVRTWVFGKYKTGPSYQSRITHYHAIPGIDTDRIFLKAIRRFAGQHKDKKIFLMGCGDNYVALIGKHKKDLPENVIAPCIDFELMDILQQKEEFYKLADEYGIDHPATLIYRPEMGMDFRMDFGYPCILKPSDGIQYWEHPFASQNKVYTIKNRAELEQVISDIYGAGYAGSLIIQDMIPGNDEYMRVLTSYSDQNGKVKMMCLGHVLLEEHTPKGKGNHALILTEYDHDLLEKVRKLLEDLHYVGFSNFDIKYDRRDGKFKFFELNTRQGRSNYYVTGSGFNIAYYLVEDYIYHHDIPVEYAKEPHLWTVVPFAVAFRYVKDRKTKQQMARLILKGEWVNPIFMKGDLGMPRLARMIKTHLSHYYKFARYYK